jgi:formate dehydrogenase assembly factor FdhD|tara:strand:- start:510 stop:716 length:207 start_codon:yes stop_codon:yes gene_type:complete
MVRVKIRYTNKDVVTVIGSDLEFVDFVKGLFTSKVYVSVPKDDSSIPIAINTDNIITIEEDKHGTRPE